MNDSQFDDFVNDRLKEYAAPVPADLWEKVAEGQFDQFIGNKLRDHSAPVPEGVWDKIADHQFDQFIAGKLDPTEAQVPAGLWDRIADGQFDAFVAGKVGGYEAAVPAGLWEKVRPEEEDHDRVGFFWFRYPAAAVLILALLTAGAWGGYLFFAGKKEAASTKQTATVPPVVTPPAGTTAITADPSQNNSSNNNSSYQEKPSAGQPNTAAGATANQQQAGADGGAANVREQAGAVERSPLAGSAITTIPLRNTAQNRLAAPDKKTTGFTTDPSQLLQQSAGNPVVSVVEKETVDDRNDINIGAYVPGFTEEATVSQAGFTLKDLSDKKLSSNLRRLKSVIICPADKGRNKDWFLETYLSPDVAFKSVNNVSASSLYMLKKDSAERSGIGFSAGVRLVKPITDNFLVKAGVQFTQAHEKYTYRTENEIKTTTVVTVRTIIRAPGDTVIVQDTSVLQTAGFKTNKVNTNIRSIDVPLTVGYQFGDDDLKFGINAGVVFNMTTWYQGMVLDSTLANVPLNKSGNGIYKTNLGMGLVGSISIVKKLSDDLHLFAEPYFRYNLSNMSTTQSGFNQRLHLGGLAVGLRFNLNKY